MSLRWPGYNVLMTDISRRGSLSRALGTIEKNLERQVSRGKVMPADKRRGDGPDFAPR
jgi:3-hydroxybutyryl-CoA dehydrogenase